MTEIETTIPGRRITAGPTELRIENTNTGGMIRANQHPTAPTTESEHCHVPVRLPGQPRAGSG